MELLWEQMKLLSKSEVREILVALYREAELDFRSLRRRVPSIPYSTANQLIKKMAAADLIEYSGGQRSGWKIRANRKLRIPQITLELIYTKEKGSPPLPSR